MPDVDCYHCGLPVLPQDNFSTEVLGQQRSMCCPGCQAVAEAIVEGGLEDYYRFRTEKADKGDILLDNTLDKLNAYDDEIVIDEFIVNHGDKKQIQLTIEGISCAACGWLIEKHLRKMPGLARVSVNVTARRASIEWETNRLKLSDILKTIEKIGYHALPFQPDQNEALYQKQNKDYLKKLGVAGLMSMQVMMLAIGLYFGIFGSIDEQTKSYFHWISLGLTTPVVLYSGSHFYKSAWNSVKAKSVNMDLSITLAVWGTFISSAYATVTHSGDIYFESVCMFIFLLLISRYLEHRSRQKAVLSSANMLKYVPQTATLISNDQYVPTLARKLKLGDCVLVKVGEVIPVDGVIIEGNSQVEESMLTGEFEPVSKTQNDNVYGGTLNKSNVLKIKVTSVLKDALVNQIVRMQEFALAEKPQIARFADRTSRHFVYIVLVIAVLSYVVWLSIDPQRAYWIAIAVLVATCPCALALATPSALTSAMASLNKIGFLLKRADVLEQLPKIDTLVFDKTGTLTEGKFSLQKIEVLNDESIESVTNIIANIESHSEHPIAKAFETTESLNVQEVKIHPGSGIEAQIEGVLYRVGSIKFMQNSVPTSLNWASVFLEINEQLLAACSVSDEIKEDIPELLNSLNEHKLVILSGDSKRNATSIGEQLGIDTIYAECSPKEKLAVIKEIQRGSNGTIMIGDGINDAPVMAGADISIAVGNATDIAKRSADVVVLGKDVKLIKSLFKMAERTQKIIKQNMLWAIGYNLLVLPLAVFGYLTPWMAVIGMSLSSIVVVSNSVRLTK